MMKFTRGPRPHYLDNYKAWGKEYAEQRENGNREFKWRTRVKNQLKTDLAKLTASHCSFCDSYPLGQETIEHFRPRSQFPKWAYAWHNLFLCCETCQRAKDDRFNRQLLKPDRLNYDFKRYFIANFKTGEIQVNPEASVDDRERARMTITMYNLDGRAIERRTYRERIMNRISKGKIKLPRDIDDLSYRFLFE